MLWIRIKEALFRNKKFKTQLLKLINLNIKVLQNNANYNLNLNING